MTAREALTQLGANPDDVAAMTLTQVLAEIAERTKPKYLTALATSKPKAQ